MLSLDDYARFYKTGEFGLLRSGEQVEYVALDGTEYLITANATMVEMPTQAFQKPNLILSSAREGVTQKYKLMCGYDEYCEITAVKLNTEVQDVGVEIVCSDRVTTLLSKIGGIKYFVEKYGAYPPQNHMRYKFGSFVLSTLCPEYKNKEDNKSDNTPDKKHECMLSIHEGKLFSKDMKIFTTECEKKACNDNGNYIWILDKKGRIFSTSMYGEKSGAAIGNNHSFFLKGKLGDECYGFGKPIACGGEIKVNKGGKITFLNNASGHYKPNYHQLVLAIKYLKDLNAFDEHCEISWHDGTNVHQQDLKDLDLSKVGEIIGLYDELS